jgi:hypothetical protein
VEQALVMQPAVIAGGALTHGTTPRAGRGSEPAPAYRQTLHAKRAGGETTMNTRNASPQNRGSERETLEQKQTQLLERAAAHQRNMIVAWVSATAIAMVATVTLLESCGSDQSSIKPASTPHETVAAPQQNVVASTAGAQLSSGTPAAVPAASSQDANSVPPDAVVALSDTFVTAGQPIEVKVEGTPDVTEMALSDGRGDALPMVKDSTGNVWRVNYRVPLRPRTDRLGLSVTAKNGSSRWRRVWVFLQIEDGKQHVQTGAQPDSTTGQK